MIMDTDKGEGSRFDEIRRLTLEAVDAGRLEEASQLAEEGLAWAQEHGTEVQIDRAVCNRASLAIQLGSGERELTNLREILMRGADPTNCWMAAYNLSEYYENAKNYKKSLFYARIALDRGEALSVERWIGSSLNQLGNAYLGESRIEEAAAEYERALSLMSGDPSVRRALTLNNLGYCRVLQKRFSEGYHLLYQSLSILRRFGGSRYQALPHLDLCFAHLETGRYHQARVHGSKALRLAESTGQIDAMKNALYLLGESANLSGDVDAARGYFTRLHRDYYPEATYLPGFLLAVDVRKLVNLHA